MECAQAGTYLSLRSRPTSWSQSVWNPLSEAAGHSIWISSQPRARTSLVDRSGSSISGAGVARNVHALTRPLREFGAARV